MDKCKIVFLLFIMVTFLNCKHNSKTDKYHDKRNNVINIKDHVKEINITNVLINGAVRMYIMDDYLVVNDPQGMDKLVHIFDKYNFKYINSAVPPGRGPGEITGIGHLEYDKAAHNIYISDHGKMAIYSYNLDSLIVDPFYMPDIKMEMVKGKFPDAYHYINDTLSIGIIIEPIGNSDYAQYIGRWNMLTGESKPMKAYPKVKKPRVGFALSEEHKLLAVLYRYHDLISIHDLEGELKFYIYGPENNWNSRERANCYYFADFYGDKLITSFSGGNERNDYLPTKFYIFDLNGDYIKTLEIGYQITHFCIDKDNNRMILALDDADMQFAYLDLEGIF